MPGPDDGRPLVAWDLIGYDGPDHVRVVGGRALWDGVAYNDDTRQNKPKLFRIAATASGLRVHTRYVDPDTPVEIIE